MRDQSAHLRDLRANPCSIGLDAVDEF